MILVFGGTTEGRRAVEVLEEAGTPYYYSTRGDMQQTQMVHGRRLTGTMDAAQTATFCREHAIRLLVDAAHPFAGELHRNLLTAAAATGVPLIRYDRIYPAHDADAVWCRDYDDAISQLEAHGVERLLALTGVNTIGRMRRYWEKHECWWRILDRSESKTLAERHHFAEDHLVYYEHDSTDALISMLHPQAILTKESGLSGGFVEKSDAARHAGIKLFVVERPPYPPPTVNNQLPAIHYVDGPHGLRRAVERLLPEFYPLKSGLTTGTCATAAAIAATRRLLTGEEPAEVGVVLPDGETISVGVGYGDGYAYCIKDAGDDPDVTDGIEVRAAVEPYDSFEIRGGRGVGRFTLPGFDYPPGSPAINKSPRRMIEDNVSSITKSKLSITISVPDGEAIAQKTFNPRLGIEGGISIIGVSGIVKPFSEEAFIESIRKCMEVARASGSERVVINSGAKSERFVRSLYPTLPRQAFVEYGNYIGQTLGIADELGFAHVTLGVMLGKAVKLAAGHLDTHSRRATMDKAFIAAMLAEAGCPTDLGDVTLARELWQRLDAEGAQRFADVVMAHCYSHCRPLVPHSDLRLLLIDDDGHIYGTP